jgi:crotonobetainyl-CoA:carnitine CoA-transferase CaiB-like acyl-CoA transferase
VGGDLGQHTREVLADLLHLTEDQIAAATAANATKENLPA